MRLRVNEAKNGGLIGIFFGILLVIGSFIWLWSNEGRVNWGDVAAESQVIAADGSTAVDPNQLVAITGPLKGLENIGDSPYLRPGAYIAIERTAEMYAWVEHTKESESSNSKTVTYEMTWTHSPPDSANFDQPRGHQNASLTIESNKVFASRALIGNYEFTPADVILPDSHSPTLTRQDVMAETARFENNMIYLNGSVPSDPKVGDVRLVYTVVQNEPVATGFGRVENGRLEPYLHKGNQIFERIISGDRATAIASLQMQYTTILWFSRIGGFLMMWLGFVLVVNPLTHLLGRIPIIGRGSNILINFVLGALAAVLSLITIVISALVHSILGWLILLVIAFVGVGYMWQKGEKSETAVS